MYMQQERGQRQELTSYATAFLLFFITFLLLGLFVPCTQALVWPKGATFRGGFA